MQVLPDWNVTSSEWFAYEADGGEHMCEVDLVLTKGCVNDPTHVIAVECKLTETIAGKQELEQLYLPVLSKVFTNAIIAGVLCFKNPSTSNWSKGLSSQKLYELKSNEIIQIRT